MMFKWFNLNKPKAAKKKKKHPAFVVPKVLAVFHYATWSEASAGMLQKFNNLKNRFDGKEVLFVTLDFTNNTTKYQAALMVAALGIDEVAFSQKGVGFVMLYDFTTRKAIAKLTEQISFTEMTQLLMGALETTTPEKSGKSALWIGEQPSKTTEKK